MGLVHSVVQHILDSSTLDITNATMFWPNDIRGNPWAMQFIEADMYNAGPTTVTLKSFTQTMTMKGDYTLIGAPANASSVKIAQFTFPETELKTGKNHIKVAVNMTIFGNDGECGSAPCFTVFSTAVGVESFFPTINAWMELGSDDMKVQTLGLPVPGVYQSAFKLACHIIAGGKPPVHGINTSTLPECQMSRHCSQPVQIRCEQIDAFTTTTTTTTTMVSTSTEAPTTSTEGPTTSADVPTTSVKGPTTSAEAPKACTPDLLDPWATGKELECCDGLGKVLNNWDGDGRWFYKCADADSVQPPSAVTV